MLVKLLIEKAGNLYIVTAMDSVGSIGRVEGQIKASAIRKVKKLAQELYPDDVNYEEVDFT